LVRSGQAVLRDFQFAATRSAPAVRRRDEISSSPPAVEHVRRPWCPSEWGVRVSCPGDVNPSLAGAASGHQPSSEGNYAPGAVNSASQGCSLYPSSAKYEVEKPNSCFMK
jgi:hypothetical protein